MLPNHPINFENTQFTNTCCICNKQFKDSIGGYKNSKISASCTCGVVNDNICENCKYNNLECPKCDSPAQLINVLY